MAEKHMKKISFFMREFIKNHIGIHYTPTRMVKIKNTKKFSY